MGAIEWVCTSIGPGTTSQSYTVHALLLMAGPALDLRFERQVGSCVAEHDGICLKNPSLLQSTLIPSPFPPKHHPHQTFPSSSRSVVSRYLFICNHVWRRVSSIFLPHPSRPSVRCPACIGLPLTSIYPAVVDAFLRPDSQPAASPATPLLFSRPRVTKERCGRVLGLVSVTSVVIMGEACEL